MSGIFTEDILNLKEINRSSAILDRFDCYVNIVRVFQQFLSSLITYLTVCGACWAFILTEKADAVKCYTSHVSFESTTPTHCRGV